MTIELKGGNTTEDPRLDRLVSFDEKSRNFPIRAVLEEERPLRSYGWACPAWLDQGQEGACVGFAWAHELSAWPVGVKKIDDKFAREKIYWEAQKIDQWDGGSYPGATPQYEGTSILAGAKAVNSAGYMDEYRWAFGLDDTLRVLGYFGPVVIGVNWHEGMFEPDEFGLIHPTGAIRGGHAVLVRGVALKARIKGMSGRHAVVRIRNSWGRKWGNNGDTWMLVEEFEQLLAADGEVCVPLFRNREPKPDTELIQQILEEEHGTAPLKEDAEPVDADHQVDVKGRGSSELQEFEDFLQKVARGDENVPLDESVADNPLTNESPLLASAAVITRAQWGARPPKSISTSITPKGVGVHHQGPGLGSFAHDRCFHLVRAIQNFHMDSRKWADIAYNGLPCPHGYVFEGRGLRRRSAANGTDFANQNYYALCAIKGDGDRLVEDMKVGINVGIEWLRRNGAGQEVHPHSLWRPTGCPGIDVRAWLAEGRPGGSNPPSPSGPRTLQYGHRGADVKEWQLKLMEYFKGQNPLPKYGADSHFGDETLAYTLEFQSREGLPKSGMVGAGDRSHMTVVLKQISKGKRYAMLLFAKRGTVDMSSAIAVLSASNSRGVITQSLDEAKEAKSRGEKRIIVGGPAARELFGGEPETGINWDGDSATVVGKSGLDTLNLLSGLAEKGWKK